MTVYSAITKGSSTSAGLQDMVLKIKKLEMELGCHLEVIHVPGTTIITERTDGLSRGIWISAFHPRPDQAKLISTIFSPAPFSPSVQSWALNEAGYPHDAQCTFRDWKRPWKPRHTFNRMTFWCPPPELAAQLLYYLLQCYVERPLTTSALVLIPRVMQRRWSRPSCCVVEVGVYQRHLVPFLYRDMLTIPVVLLLIPCHVRIPSISRMDSAPQTALWIYHRQQAALVRGVLEALDKA
jgi:hypothetical protein